MTFAKGSFSNIKAPNKASSKSTAWGGNFPNPKSLKRAGPAEERIPAGD